MLKHFITTFGPNVVRHATQVGAGALIANGIIDQTQGEQVAGAAIVLVTILWSVVEKKGLLKWAGL